MDVPPRNRLVPALFGLRTVSFRQALGFLTLCRILFGGFGRGGEHRSRMRRRWAERWERMTPEVRERLRGSSRGSWNDREPPAPMTNAAAPAGGTAS